MGLGIIVAIILIGLLLIVVELFVIPGTTIFGLFGLLAVAAGIIIAYAEFGAQTGTIILALSSVVSVILVILGFKAIQSKWVSVNEEITSKVNVLEEGLAIVGDKGITFSSLRPNGKAIINGKKLEVYSQGDYIDRDKEIVVTKVTTNRIFVKLINPIKE